MAAPIVMDGSAITTISLNHLPTSRGRITLESADPKDSPVIDHQHLSTKKDKLVIRTAARKALDLMNTSSGKEIVTGELVAPDRTPLVLGATDEEIDIRIKEQSQ
jgi:choline dehydrogenase